MINRPAPLSVVQRLRHPVRTYWEQERWEAKNHIRRQHLLALLPDVDQWPRKIEKLHGGETLPMLRIAAWVELVVRLDRLAWHDMALLISRYAYEVPISEAQARAARASGWSDEAKVAGLLAGLTEAEFAGLTEAEFAGPQPHSDALTSLAALTHVRPRPDCSYDGGPDIPDVDDCACSSDERCE